MKHVFAISAIFVSIMLSLFIAPDADAVSILTKSFGSKVLLTPIPLLTCTGSGQSVLLSSNVKGLTDTLSSAAHSGSEGKARGILKGILKMIPTYTTDPTKVPETGKDILGREKIIPNFSLCSLSVGTVKIPIPVYKTTDNYGVAQKN